MSNIAIVTHGLLKGPGSAGAGPGLAAWILTAPLPVRIVAILLVIAIVAMIVYTIKNK